MAHPANRGSPVFECTSDSMITPGLLRTSAKDLFAELATAKKGLRCYERAEECANQSHDPFFWFVEVAAANRCCKKTTIH